MKILFSGTPAFGHVLPMLPLARAATRAGHEVAMLTGPGLAAAVRQITVLEVGLSFAQLLVENARRHPTGMGSANGSAIGPTEAAEFFASTRVELTYSEALTAGRLFTPDFIVAESADYIGPLVADALGVPWVRHAFGVELPSIFVEKMDALALENYVQNRVAPNGRSAYLDPCPDFLQRDDWNPPADRITIRPEAFAVAEPSWELPEFPRTDESAVILITFGTVVQDDGLLAAVLDSLEATGVRVLITARPGAAANVPPNARDWAVDVGFVPLAELLEKVDVVVTVGGAGTVLSSLSAQKPLVVIPVLPDHHWNAERAAASGAAIVAGSPIDVGPAVRTILTDPSFQMAATKVAYRFDRMNSPEAALELLVSTIANNARRE